MPVSSAASATTTTEKGRRVLGAERQTLAKDLVQRYSAGESIRGLAASTGRSYGFVHRVLTESGVPIRKRPAAKRQGGGRQPSTRQSSALTNMEIRLPSAIANLLRKAAEVAREDPSDFVEKAVEERADRVLRALTHATIVPSEFFDQLLAAMESPASPNDRLVNAARRVGAAVEQRW